MLRGGCCALDPWVLGRFTVLVLAALSVGVCDPSPVEALARDAERSSARILSRACLSSASACMALSSAA